MEREIPASEIVYMEMPEGYDVTASTFEYAYGHSSHELALIPYDRTGGSRTPFTGDRPARGGRAVTQTTPCRRRHRPRRRAGSLARGKSVDFAKRQCQTISLREYLWMMTSQTWLAAAKLKEHLADADGDAHLVRVAPTGLP